LLYATLTAWGMHRMGDADVTKTKLTNWDEFSESIHSCGRAASALRNLHLLAMPADELSARIEALRPVYAGLRLTASGATVVVNSKALYHLLPNLIPPIDRQYTVRFLLQPPEKWKDANGKFRMVSLPSGIDAQFHLFHTTCVRLKQLADRVNPSLFDEEWREHHVTAPKALDNAIVNYVKTVSSTEPSAVRCMSVQCGLA
jgi:hypothetical protein